MNIHTDFEKKSEHRLLSYRCWQMDRPTDRPTDRRRATTIGPVDLKRQSIY